MDRRVARVTPGSINNHHDARPCVTVATRRLPLPRVKGRQVRRGRESMQVRRRQPIGSRRKPTSYESVQEHSMARFSPRFSRTMIATALATLAGGVWAGGQPEKVIAELAQPQRQYVASEMLVQFKPGVAQALREAAL